MKALVSQSGQVVCTNLSMPIITDEDDIILQVIQAGICRTDLLVADGSIPGCAGEAFGHEFCGRVVTTGDKVDKFYSGQRVAVNPVLACGQCGNCKENDDYLCSHSGLLGINSPGAFAEYIKVSMSQCYAVPDTLPDRLVAYAEPVAAMLSVLTCGIKSQHKVAILGSDRIARLCQFILSTEGLDAISVNEDTLDEILLVDVLIVTSFFGENLPLNLVKPGGLLVIKNRCPFGSKVCFADVVQRRLTLVGANYAPFSIALKFIESHQQDLMNFIGESYPLVKFEEAFNCDASTKVFLEPCVD